VEFVADQSIAVFETHCRCRGIVCPVS